MKLHVAQAIAAKLLKRLAPIEHSGSIVGSVRRCKPEPGDIELALPWGEGSQDHVYQRLVQLVGPPEAELFGHPAPAGPRSLEAIKGLKPGFRLCVLRSIPGSTWAKVDPALESEPFQVDLFRFDTGPLGNRGWVELQRTGPAEFGRDCLALFKRHGGGGSKDGYLIDGDGQPIPTPTEFDAFRVLQVAWLDPRERCPEAIRHETVWHEPVPAEAIPF